MGFLHCTICYFLLIVGSLIPSPSFGQTTQDYHHPNVVLIFVDDMGFGDLSCYGALKYRTKHLDQLANEGIRLTNFLSAQAVCSASRAGILTGCYPNRIGISGALFPNSQIGIHADEVTMAELLKAQGYRTGMVGKWHLGDQPEFLPLQNGFDEYLGLPYSNDMWPMDYDGTPATDWRVKSFPPLYLIEGNKKTIPVATLEDQAELTGRYTQRAVDFIQRNKDHPFFLYMAHSMPHVPIAASKAFRGKSDQGLYGDVMLEIDWSVGQVLEALRSNGVENNTLIIFTSDNGPWLNFGNHAGSTGGLREGKGTTFEGGQREPCIIRWPAQIQPGQVSNALSSTIDLFPTVAEITDARLPDHKIDGVSLLPVLLNPNLHSPRSEFYYYYRKNSLEAVRRDEWKMVFEHPGRTYEKFPAGKDGYPGEVDEHANVAMGLYNLRSDPGERYDLKDSFPEKVKELEALAAKVREDLGDDLTDHEGANRRPPGHHPSN